MRYKLFLLSAIVLFLLNFGSAAVFYDQGTDVVNSTGDILENGTLEIYIYDAASGGNLVYNKNSSGGIINGSWNIKIEPDLEYGKIYYKDYVIEGDNLNFSGDDRIQFQSPFGLINNASLFNFSLIDSCPSGSSIRQVYENGSVVCEADDSGDVNLSNYALTNESEVFEENITVVNYGFFGWLGSLVNRITGLFVQDINVNNSITLNGTTIESWDDVNNSAVDTDTQKNASGYLYNDSTTIYLNETMLNDTIDLRSGGTNYTHLSNFTDDLGHLEDNSSWNESYADTKYISQSDESNLDVNSSVYSNSTNWWASLSSWLSGWFVNNGGQLEFNETKLNETISIEGVNLGFNLTYNSTYDSKTDYEFGNNNFNGTGNMTASYFIGNGSMLTDLSISSGEINSSQVKMNELFELKDWYDSFQSAGRISGGLVSSNGDGTVAVLGGNGLIKNGSSTPTNGEYCPIENCSAISDTIYVTWGNVSSLSLTDEAYNYIYYNGSSGAVESTIDFYSVDFTRDFTLGRVYRSGNDVTVRLCGTNIWNFNRRVQLFGEERFPVERANGMMISETGTRNIRITAGIIWAELVNRFTTNAFDSSLSTNNFTYWYQNGTSGWSEVSEVSQIDNLNWDDGTGTLNDLSNNKYGVHWVYEVHDSSVHVLYGRGDYTLSEAQLAAPPSNLPGLVNSYASLVGKIIIAKSASSFAEVLSPFTVSFSSSVVQNHNDLSNIQGGTVGEYYHINNSQYSDLQSGISGNYTNGNCWFYYSGGIATSTNCSQL